MELQKRKCSSSKHPEIDAISYCQYCKKYFCNKCQIFHSEIFQDHNTLCCLGCLCKIKEDGYGQHHDCNVIQIKKMKDEKRNKLKENINNLEELYNQIDKSINKLKEIYEQINKNKDDLKLKIQGIFTKLRSILNEKEDKLLLDIDENYNNIYIKNDLIKKVKNYQIK